jgi:hypothetical protein
VDDGGAGMGASPPQLRGSVLARLKAEFSLVAMKVGCMRALASLPGRHRVWRHHGPTRARRRGGTRQPHRLGALSILSQAQIEAAPCCRRRSSAQSSASGAGETIGATLTHCPSAWHARSAALRAAIADTSSALTAVSRAEG